MPCRKENYILLEQSVTVGPTEVDALVTRIGEALQLSGKQPGGSDKMSCCRRSRAPRGSSRASPYRVPADQDWDHIRPWNRKRIRVDEDDPHRLLQELILSGNLIKEAVRRLQDLPRTADTLPCS